MIEIKNVTILDVEKRKEKLVGSYYIYLIEVKNERTAFQIFRRYTELYDLHNELLQIFPRHLGFDVPEFPPRTIFRPSARVAQERVKLLNSYFSALCSNAHMCSCSILKDYLSKRTRDDMAASKHVRKERKEITKLDIGNPTPQEEYTLAEKWIQGGVTELPTTQAGATVTVIEKTEAGWWLVTSDAGKTQGWIGSAFLNTKHTEETPVFVDVGNDPYIVTETYQAQGDDELSVLKGEKVEVTRQFIDGWLNIKRGNAEGIVPQDILRPASQADLEIPIPKPRQRAKRGQSKKHRK